MTLDLASKIEALLFSEGGTLSKKKLSQFLSEDDSAIDAALSTLQERRAGSALALIVGASEAALTVAPEAAETIEKAFEKELGKEIGEAGLEVLAIILYCGPSTRARIDYIRGVNTSWTIRSLVARGLIERTANPEDAREYLYKPTVELLAHLGTSRLEELPDYAKIASELAAFEHKTGPFYNHESRDSDATAEA